MDYLFLLVSMKRLKCSVFVWIGVILRFIIARYQWQWYIMRHNKNLTYVIQSTKYLSDMMVHIDCIDELIYLEKNNEWLFLHDAKGVLSVEEYDAVRSMYMLCGKMRIAYVSKDWYWLELRIMQWGLVSWRHRLLLVYPYRINDLPDDVASDIVPLWWNRYLVAEI